MQLGGKLDYFCDTVFNYPTMAEAYRVAAFNGMNRLSTEHEIMAEEMTRSSDPVANLDKISAAISACETPVVLMPNVTI